MKILLDPIYTNDPALCSMCWKMHKFMKHVLSQRTDVFFYVVLPTALYGNEEWQYDESFLMHSHPNVTYVEVPTSRDRFVEYYRLDNKWIEQFCFYGEKWDWDYCFTARIPMVPSILSFAIKSRVSKEYTAPRYVLGVEDMPIVSFKKCVGQFDPRVQDMSTITGYLATECTWVLSFWESREICRVASNWFSSSQVKDLRKKLVDATPYKYEGLTTKTDDVITKLETGERPFTLGFTQRFEVVHRGCVKVMDLFKTQWIVRDKKMRFIVTSNSRSAKGVPEGKAGEAIQFMRLPRDEFWKMMREECDCFVVMSIDDAYPMSLLEPILLGVPCVLLQAPYAESMLGSDYPFFVKNEDQAYAMVREFYANYRDMYALFVEWVNSLLRPIMEARNESLMEVLQYRKIMELEAAFTKTKGRFDDNEVVKPLLEGFEQRRIAGGGAAVVSMFEVMDDLGAQGVLRHLTPQGNDTFKSKRYMKDWTVYRKALLHAGWHDMKSIGLFSKGEA